jgi:hypothetical protein
VKAHGRNELRWHTRGEQRTRGADKE